MTGMQNSVNMHVRNVADIRAGSWLPSRHKAATVSFTTWPVAGLPSGRVRGQPGSLIRVRYAVQRMMGACC